MSLGTVRRLLGRVPGSRPVHRLAARAIHVARSVRSPFLRFAPAGHFYSPLPDAREIPQDPLGGDVAELPGIDLAEAEQLAMLERMAPFHAELPWGEEQRPGLRYAYRNPFFNHNDAVVLFGMMRALRPRRVIEVGSGWSSAAMLDIRDRFPEVATRFTFVEPYPQRLLSLLGADGGGGAEILPVPVQQVPMETFAELAAGDVLFVDSSHVLKTGSDVAHLLFEVLPRLAPGVVVHVHDVIWPFEYPSAWYAEGRAWNEAFAVRAFLLYNGAFRILYFNSLVSRRHRARLADALPTALADDGQGIWLRRT